MEFIIPSMWRKPSFTIAALEYYVSIKEITKLIIIDNDINRRPKSEVFDSNKIKIIDYGKNLYVNAVKKWTKGNSKIIFPLLGAKNEILVGKILKLS